MMFSGHRVLVVTVLTLLLGQLRHVHSWINSYDQTFSFTCKEDEFVSVFSSQHFNSHEDRLFGFRCRSLPVKKGHISCAWSPVVNDLEGPLVYQCPHDGYMVGVSSYHVNKNDDRRFKVYCCRSPALFTHDCYYTGWLNGFDQKFQYTVPDKKIMKGMVSVHSILKKDRRFQFQICDLKKARTYMDRR